MTASKIPVSKTAAWYANTVQEISKAGGAITVIDMFSPELIDTMIRNDLHIVFDKKIELEVAKDQIPTVYYTKNFDGTWRRV